MNDPIYLHKREEMIVSIFTYHKWLIRLKKRLFNLGILLTISPSLISKSVLHNLLQHRAFDQKYWWCYPSVGCFYPRSVFMTISQGLPDCLTIRLSLPDHLTGSAWLSLCPSIFRFAYLTGSAWLSHCLSICLRLTISQGLLDCLTHRLSVFAWLSHRVYLTVSLSVYLFVYLTLLLLHYLTLSVGSNEFIFFYSIPDTLSIVGGWNQTIQLEGER